MKIHGQTIDLTGMTVATKPVNKNQVFERAEDKNVAGVIVYLKAADSKLYYNLDGTTYSNEVPSTDLKNLFLKGAMVDNGTGIYKAIGYDTTNGITWAIPSN